MATETASKDTLHKNASLLKISGMNCFTTKSNSISLSKRFSRNPAFNANTRELAFNLVNDSKKSFDSSMESEACFNSGDVSKRSFKQLATKGLVRRREVRGRCAREMGELQRTLKTVASENARLRQLSAEMMKEQQKHLETPSTIHSFYQNVVLPENEANIKCLKEKIKMLKMRLINAMTENEKLVRENERLKKAVSRYRGLACDQSRERKQDRSFIKDITPRKSFIQTASNRATAEDLSAALKFSKENLRLDIILCSLKKLSKAHTVKQLIEQLYSEMAILVKSCRIGVFLINRDIQELYYREQGLVQSTTMSKHVVDFVVNGNRSYSMQPVFSSVTGFKDVVRSEEAIAIPIVYARYGRRPELYMAVQLEFRNCGAEAKAANSKELLVSLPIRK